MRDEIFVDIRNKKITYFEDHMSVENATPTAQTYESLDC